MYNMCTRGIYEQCACTTSTRSFDNNNNSSVWETQFLFSVALHVVFKINLNNKFEFNFKSPVLCSLVCGSGEACVFHRSLLFWCGKWEMDSERGKNERARPAVICDGSVATSECCRSRCRDGLGMRLIHQLCAACIALFCCRLHCLDFDHLFYW